MQLNFLRFYHDAYQTSINHFFLFRFFAMSGNSGKKNRASRAQAYCKETSLCLKCHMKHLGNCKWSQRSELCCCPDGECCIFIEPSRGKHTGQLLHLCLCTLPTFLLSRKLLKEPNRGQDPKFCLCERCPSC